MFTKQKSPPSNMKSFAVVAVASLLTHVCATPVEKRALVVNTVIEEVTETVDVTTTIWVKPTDGAHANYQLPVPKHQHHHHSHKPKPVTPSTTTTPYVAPVPTTPTTTSTSSTSTPTSIPVPVYTPPVVSTPVYTPPAIPATTPAPVNTPKPTTQAQAPVATTPATSPGTSGGACGTIGGECSGFITFYTPGLGSCGVYNTESDMIFALGHDMFDPHTPGGPITGNPNNNPWCGRMAKIEYNGKTAIAKLTDRCPTCAGGSIDLSPALFKSLADPDLGRIPDVKWSFTT